MKVLIVHSRYRSGAPSGENAVVDQEGAALAEAGHSVETFQRNSDDIAEWPLSRKVGVPAKSLWNQQARQQLAGKLASDRPDVVHVHNTFPLLSPSVLYACRDSGVPVVITVHNYKLLCASGVYFRDGAPCHECAAGSVTPAIRHGCYRGSRPATIPVVAGMLAHRRSWRDLVSAYIFLSVSQRDALAALDLPADRVFIKHNFVDDPSGPSVVRHEPFVLYAGRLDEPKGAPLLMRAWERFAAQRPAAALDLVIAGGGSMADEVSSWARSVPGVRMVGMQTRAQVQDLMGRARAVVVPSQWEETFGLVAVEAMAARTAPIASRHGSFPELIDDGVDGRLFDPEDPADLARILGQAADDPDLFAQLGDCARSTFEAKFDRAASVQRLTQIYDFAIKHPRGNRS